MTYDFSKHSNDLPNAPLLWVESVLSSFIAAEESFRPKLLLGIPMYGWRGEEAMIGEHSIFMRYRFEFQVADTMVVWLVQEEVQVEWDEVAREHIFSGVRRQCAFPTPLFVQQRLGLAKELGIAGVALWEVGQMMPMLMDLF